MNTDAYRISGELQEELAKDGREVLPRLIRELREVRDEQNALKKRADQLRKHVEGMLEDAGGEFIDEVSGLRAWIEKQLRYDYDPTRLHRLVADGLLTESEFADCLETVVKKPVIAEWIGKGLITERQLNNAGAKVGTSITRIVQIRPMGARR